MPEKVNKQVLKKPPVQHASKNTSIYNMIRFWGRKPWNLVRAYIENYTEEGEIVLDPFAGCGVVAFESLKIKRRTVYNDLNKYFTFIARASAVPVDLEILKKTFDKLLGDLRTKQYPVLVNGKKQEFEISWFYSTSCPNCKSIAEILSVTYTRIYETSDVSEDQLLVMGDIKVPKRLVEDDGKMSQIALEVYKMIEERGPISHQRLIENLSLNVRAEEITKAINFKLEKKGLIKEVGETPISIEFRCSNKVCGVRRGEKKLDEDDVNKFKQLNKMRSCYFTPKEALSYDSERFFTQRPGTERVDKLFTVRNRIVLSIVREEIKKLEVEKNVKEVLLLCLAAILEHVCKMERPNKKGWGVKNYIIHPIFLEQNVLYVFKNRFKSIIKGKEEAHREIGKFFQESNNPAGVISGEGNVCFLNEDARRLPISDCAVDYIFTDPEYGDSIQYYELSKLGASWLGFDNDWESEIVVNPKQGKTIDIYRNMLCEAFKEAYRVLKPDRYMTVTFHSREIKYWNALMYAIQVAGFRYVSAVYQVPQKEYTNWIYTQNPGEMTGDIYVTFYKPVTKSLPSGEDTDINQVIDNVIVPQARQIILLHNGEATFDQLARGVTLSLIEKGLMHDSKIRDLRYVEIFDKYFERLGRAKIWRLRRKEKREYSLVDFIPLDRRIEWIAYSVFNKKGNETTIDDILSAIFTTLKNSKTPENREILSIIREIAEPVKGGGKRPFWECKEEGTRYLPGYEPAPPFTLKTSPAEELDHGRVISVISRFGKIFGYNVWIGEPEIRKNSELKKHRDLERLEVAGVDKIALDRLKNVDVVWFLRKTIPVALIEVEHTTNIRQGLLRMANVFEAVPNLNVETFVVLPNKRQEKLGEVLREPSIKALVGERVVYYATYSLIAELSDQQQEYKKLSFNDFRQVCNVFQSKA